MPKIFVVEFENYDSSFRKIAEQMQLDSILAEQKKIVLKPNLTIDFPPPVTTDVRLVEVVLKYCLENSSAQILIAEGSGGCDTERAFEKLGYSDLGKQYDIKLVDLNKEERIELSNPQALKLKKIKFPKILLNSFFISLAVPKEHSEAVYTGSLKNLVGLYLNENLPENNWWSKSDLHRFGLSECIFDLSFYQKIDLTILDARIGQKGDEIKGSPCQPALNKLAASFNALAIDVYGASLLDRAWQKIKYLSYLKNRGGEFN